jgi:ABC-2 type transport system ATP-binding protein
MDTMIKASGIVAKGLTKVYAGKAAVNDLSFEVEPGTVTGFLGPNGAGKSTTMRLIMGLDKPSAGSVTVGGRLHHDLRWPLREIGALLEAEALVSGRSARAHLLALARSNAIAKKRVAEVLEMVGLASVATKRAGSFSLGMRQRLGLATALLGDPGVLVLDEPFNGLDPEGIFWMRTLLRSLAKEGRTVLVSSHLMSEVAQVADNLVVIGQGRLLAASSVSGFLAEHGKATLVVRSDKQAALKDALMRSGEVVEELGDELVVHHSDGAVVGAVALAVGAVLSELSVRGDSLEDIFMELTKASSEYHGRGGVS